MSTKEFRTFVDEVRVACERYLAATGPLDVDNPRKLPMPTFVPAKKKKPSVKGNPICKCGHNYSVHKEPSTNELGDPRNVCAGCDADERPLGCPEFVSKRGKVAGLITGASDYAHADDEARKAANGESEGGLQSVHYAILAALAAKPEKTAQQVAIIAAYVQSGTFNSAIADLRAVDMVEGSPLLQLTSYGKSKAIDVGHKYDGRSLRVAWSQKLGALGAKIIEVLHAHKSVATSGDLAALCKYVQSGTFNSMIAKMRRMGLVTKKLPLRLCGELS